MKYIHRLGLAAVVFGLTAGTAAHATNITISDGVSGGGFSGGPTGIGNEDNEVEAGAVASQKWDLEAIDLTGSSLSLWGGYDFINGEGQGANLWGSGDIFIDVNGDAKWGAGTTRSLSNSYYNYDYAVVFARGGTTGEMLTGAYSIVSLDSTSAVTQTYDWPGTLFDWSNPFRVGTDTGTIATGTLAYTSGISDADSIGLLGGSHNQLTVDLAPLSALLGGLDGALFHFTMECGNDGINGRASVPDGGTGLCLLGLGVGAVGFLRRRMN